MRDALDASRERLQLQLARPLDVWLVHNEHALPPLPPPRDDDNGGDGASHVSTRLACCSYLRAALIYGSKASAGGACPTVVGLMKTRP